MTKLCLWFAALSLVQLGCTSNCDRQACESFSKPASATITQGIAGAASLESDDVVNGCQLCALSTAGLDVWSSPVAVREGGAACPLTSRPDARNVSAIGRYEQALDPGEYLVCVSAPRARPCIGVTVAPGKVTTVNIKHMNGPTSLAVLDPGSATVRSDVFECPKVGQ
jgi:hypothetical protein